jgi:hypothetical protein
MAPKVKNLEELRKHKKQCTRCGKVKTLDLFHIAAGNRSGRTGSCSDCLREPIRRSRERCKRRNARARKLRDKRMTPHEKQLTEWWLWQPTRFGPLPPWRNYGNKRRTRRAGSAD